MSTTATDLSTKYEPVIGLEVHVQLGTATKMFCPCKAESFDVTPNTNICPVCSGLPGSLPVINKEAVTMAMRMAMALNCEINRESYFHRKNYFYPDLPKGYQITQYDEPIARNGHVWLDLPDGKRRRVGIRQLHMEEDAGKNEFDGNEWRVNFNRCGMPLIEIVSDPDLHSPEEAAHYVRYIRRMVRWLRISDADMEKGNLRCDGNISVRPIGNTELPNFKTEVKNVNSFSFIEEALTLEIDRQSRFVEEGLPIEQVTLRYDGMNQKLLRMRTKESANEYRYFREPDLLAVSVSEEWENQVRNDLPELPTEMRERWTSEGEISPQQAEALVDEKEVADYYIEACKHYKGEKAKLANWLLNDLKSHVEDQRDVLDSPCKPAMLAELLTLLDDEKITASAAKDVLEEMATTGKQPKQIIAEKGLELISDTKELTNICKKVLDNNPKQVEQYKGGKKQVVGYFIGQVKKEIGAKADAQTLQKLFAELLD